MLAAFDTQIRRSLVPPAPGWIVEDLGHLVRTTAPAGAHVGGFIEWSDLSGLSEAEVDGVIAEQVAYFRAQLTGRPEAESEWKHYDYDAPADLSDRLVAAGLTRESPEALIIGETAAVLTQLAGWRPVTGVAVRRITERDELSALLDLHRAVWPRDQAWLVDDLRAEMIARADDLQIFFAEDAVSGELMSAAWIRFTPGTDFAGLWGGSTHPEHRHRGAYRSLVEARAAVAAELGVRYLQVDASPESEPILTRLGLRRLATTTPHTLGATAVRAG